MRFTETKIRMIKLIGEKNKGAKHGEKNTQKCTVFSPLLVLATNNGELTFLKDKWDQEIQVNQQIIQSLMFQR